MKRLLLITLLFSYLNVLAFHLKEGETRSATTSMAVSTTDEITINAKYTELLIETWDKDEIEITATIKYDGKMTSEIEAFLNDFESHVNKSVSRSLNGVTIDTGVDFPNNGVKKTLFGLVIEINLGDYDQARLTYRIKAPANNFYDITNSYRDMKLVGDFKEMNIKQYSGDLRAGSIGKSKLNLKYGSASFNTLNDSEVELYEQELEVKSIGAMNGTIKYSDVEVAKAGDLELEAYESDFVIETLNSLTGTYKYGEIAVTQSVSKTLLTLYEMDIVLERGEYLHIENSKYSKLKANKLTKLTMDQSYEDETTINELGSFESMDSKYGEHEIGLLTQSVNLNAYEDDITIKGLDKGVREIKINGKYINAFIDVMDRSYSISGKVKYGKVDYDKSTVIVNRYIKDGDQLELEAVSKMTTGTPIKITINGYEVDVVIE